MKKCKKILSITLAIVLLFSTLLCASISAFAKTIRYGDFRYYIRDNNNIAIEYTGDEASVIVPSEIDGYTVTEFASEAFIYQENLTDITIPDSVTNISYAFVGCDNLKDIYYSGSEKQWKEATTYLEADALNGITVHYDYDGLLFTPTISDMITSGVLKYRYSLEDGTAEIYECTVYEPYEDETDVTIPSELDGHTVTAIGDWAFYSSAVKNLTIPETVTSIGENSFALSMYLENITIPNGVPSIGKNTFDSCLFLTEITIPKSVTSIGNSAFIGCNSLTDVYFNGTEEEWNAITIGEYNDSLLNATKHFNPVEETDKADDTATETNASSSFPSIDPVIMIVIAVAVIGVAVVVIIILKKKKIK